MRSPINVVLSNISLYSKTEEQRKEATIFLYQLIHQNAKPELKKMLEENENLRFLKDSKWYTEEAMTYPKEQH